MKNKKLFSAVAITAAVSILTLTAFAAKPSYAGYEEFKNLIKNHSEQNECISGTVNGDIQIVDNGKTVISLSGALNINHESKEMSGDFVLEADNLKKSLEVYGAEDLLYLVDVENNDVYVKEKEQENNNSREACKKNHEFSQKGEAIMDIIIGDMKKEFEVKNLSDGSKNISFELTKDEIPVALNLLVSAKGHENNDKKGCFANIEEHGLNINEYPLFKELCEVKLEHTKLIDNKELDYVKISVNVDENKELKGFELAATVSGNDENGKLHEIQVKAQMEFLNKNAANIKTIDLEGKNIINLPDMENSMKMKK